VLGVLVVAGHLAHVGQGVDARLRSLEQREQEANQRAPGGGPAIIR
jgi:hypothetical protein